MAGLELGLSDPTAICWSPRGCLFLVGFAGCATLTTSLSSGWEVVAERAALSTQWSRLPVSLEAGRTSHLLVHWMWNPSPCGVVCFSCQASCRPRGPRAASAFPAGSGLWLLAQLQGLRMAPGGTSLAPSWAEPDKMDCAAHSPDPEGSNWADRFLEGPRRPFPLLVRGRPEDQSQRDIERCLAVGFEDGRGRHEPRNAGWKKTRGQTLPKSPQRERSPASALPLAS